MGLFTFDMGHSHIACVWRSPNRELGNVTASICFNVFARPWAYMDTMFRAEILREVSRAVVQNRGFQLGYYIFWLVICNIFFIDWE